MQQVVVEGHFVVSLSMRLGFSILYLHTIRRGVVEGHFVISLSMRLCFSILNLRLCFSILKFTYVKRRSIGEGVGTAGTAGTAGGAGVGGLAI